MSGVLPCRDFSQSFSKSDDFWKFFREHGPTASNHPGKRRDKGLNFKTSAPGRRRPWHYFFRYESHSESGRGNCDLVSFTWSCVHLDFDGNVRTIMVSFFSHPHRFIPFRLPLTSTPTAMQVRGQASDKPRLIMIISIYPKFASIRNVGHEPGPCRCVYLTGEQHR